MGLQQFILRALKLSFSVWLRMIIMLLATMFGVYMLFATLGQYPYAILLIAVLTLIPLLVFLYLASVRAGLVAMRATGPPNMKRLGLGTLRMFRYNMMANNLSLMLIGLGGSVAFMVFLTPDVWALFQNEFSIREVTDLELMATLFSQVPVGLIIPILLAVAVSSGLIGTSTGALAAFSAEGGPNHDMVWGATRQFVPLFVLSVLVFAPLAAFVVFKAGGILAPLSSLSAFTIGDVAIFLIYGMWSICAISAGKAIAYVQTVKDLDAERRAELDGLMGDPVDVSALRALRHTRQENQKIKDPDA